MSPARPSIDAELVLCPGMTLAAVVDIHSLACSYIVVDIFLKQLQCQLKSALWCYLHTDNTSELWGNCKWLWFNMQPILNCTFIDTSSVLCT